MAEVKTAVVVIKRPKAAVAVSKDKFILELLGFQCKLSFWIDAVLENTFI